MRGLLGLLLLLALIVKFWVWILAGVLLWLVVKAALVAAAEIRVEREKTARRIAALIARCDQQHTALPDGDTLIGTYGQFPPAV